MKKKILSVILVLTMVTAFALGIGGCTKKQGKTFTLQEAYDAGYITRDDLLSIAYYHHDAFNWTEDGREGNEELMGEDYVPKAKAPATLSASTEEKIKVTLANEYNDWEKYEEYKITPSDVTILEYNGTYNGAVALMHTNINQFYPEMEWEVRIAGVYFSYTNGNEIFIWKEI